MKYSVVKQGKNGITAEQLENNIPTVGQCVLNLTSELNRWMTKEAAGVTQAHMVKSIRKILAHTLRRARKLNWKFSRMD